MQLNNSTSNKSAIMSPPSTSLANNDECRQTLTPDLPVGQVSQKPVKQPLKLPIISQVRRIQPFITQDEMEMKLFKDDAYDDSSMNRRKRRKRRNQNGSTNESQPDIMHPGSSESNGSLLKNDGFKNNSIISQLNLHQKKDSKTQRKISAVIETEVPICKTENIESENIKDQSNNNLISEDDFEFNENDVSQADQQTYLQQVQKRFRNKPQLEYDTDSESCDLKDLIQESALIEYEHDKMNQNRSWSNLGMSILNYIISSMSKN